MTTPRILMINPLVGDVAGNARIVREVALRARDGHGARVVVFPELMLTGYPPEDLLLRPELTQRVDAAVEGLCAKGYTILSPMGQGERSGILSFKHPVMPADILRDRLSSADIHLSVRGGGLRMSPGIYNDEDDIHAMLEHLP